MHKCTKEKQRQIHRLQQNLAPIRKIAGWTTAQMGDKIGVTKQTISNLENGKTPMTFTQYIAIRSILDCEMDMSKDSELLARVVTILLDSNNDDDEVYENNKKAIYIVAASAAGGVASAMLMGTFLKLVPSVGAVIINKTGSAPWLKAITQQNQKEENNGQKDGEHSSKS